MIYCYFSLDHELVHYFKWCGFMQRSCIIMVGHPWEHWKTNLAWLICFSEMSNRWLYIHVFWKQQVQTNIFTQYVHISLFLGKEAEIYEAFLISFTWRRTLFSKSKWKCILICCSVPLLGFSFLRSMLWVRALCPQCKSWNPSEV